MGGGRSADDVEDFAGGEISRIADIRDFGQDASPDQRLDVLLRAPVGHAEPGGDGGDGLHRVAEQVIDNPGQIGRLACACNARAIGLPRPFCAQSRLCGGPRRMGHEGPMSLLGGHQPSAVRFAEARFVHEYHPPSADYTKLRFCTICDGGLVPE